MKGLLSRMEILVGGALLLVFLMWAGNRCTETKNQLKEEAQTQAAADSLANIKETPDESAASKDILAEALSKKQNELAADDAVAKADSLKNASATTAASTTANPITNPAGSILYITIDDLKIRTEPGLTSRVLGELPLFSEVYFMNEVTDSIYSLSSCVCEIM